MLKRVLFLALSCSMLLTGCDQFARIGVEQATLLDGSPPMSAPDAMMVNDAMTSFPDASDAASGFDAAQDAGDDAAAACPSVPIQICNPVTNAITVEQGCPPELGQQCAIDQLNVLTGYCIFASPDPPTLGGACFNSGLTESCEATTACMPDGICHKLCLCDADCPAAQCCNRPIGSTGFSACGPC